jgi:hypothetical protein
MFWTFKLSLDILATVWAIGRIFVQFSGHSANDHPHRYLRKID